MKKSLLGTMFLSKAKLSLFACLGLIVLFQNCGRMQFTEKVAEANLASTSADVTPTNQCVGSGPSSCLVPNGVGSQVCQNGVAVNPCEPTSCNSGYELINNQCSPLTCSPGAQASCQGSNGSGVKTCQSNQTYGSCELSIHAEDQARVGLLALARGLWDGRMVLPGAWFGMSVEACALNPHYGFLWWLNTDGKRYPSAARDAFFATGAGGNLTWVDPSSGIVAVLRWTNPAAMDGFIGRVRGALL